MCRLAVVSFALIALLALPAVSAERGTRLFTEQASDGSLLGWKSFSEGTAKSGDVWRLANGVLHCKGKPNGYIYTEKAYSDFTLRLEWRTPPGEKPGRGGVLVRTTGPHKIWPKSLEAQLNSPDEGDFWGLDGFRLAGPAERMKTIETSPFGKLINVKKAQTALRPVGQWNQYEIVANGPTVILRINGKEVNRATDCDAVAGPICLTSEGDPIEFRAIEIVEGNGR